MSRIHSNIPALQAIHRLQRNQADLSVRLARLSTGFRINRGADDPSGLIASERLRSEIRGIEQAIDNSVRASNVISTAEGALNEVSALLLDLESLVVESSNKDGLLDAEVRANQLQIDSILDSLDRIANTTTFAGRKLLDGSRSYFISGLAPSSLPGVQIFAARVPQGGARTVNVRVTASAQTAQLLFPGSNGSGTSTTPATTIELQGTLGRELISFASGTTLTQIGAAINNLQAVTGVSAVVTSPGAGGTLALHSLTVGADAFVSVSAIGGDFVVAGNQGIEARDAGVDASVSVDGQVALVQGLTAGVRSGGLDTRLFLSRTFAQTLSSTSFAITGGGALFQLTPEISPNGQINVALNSVSTTRLGNPVSGFLFSLRSGGANDLASANFSIAQTIVEEAVSQIASFRGRLGSIQRNQIDPNINSQKVALENVTASESLIRDADIAVEVSALTRAQILVQSTQSTLQIANSIPAQVLSLLG